MGKLRITPELQAWIDARKRHRLSDAQVQMARELGMNPRKLGKLDNHRQEPWKLPLKEFIAELYHKRFGRMQPERVVSIERWAQEREARKKARKQQKLARRAAQLNDSESIRQRNASSCMPLGPHPSSSMTKSTRRKPIATEWLIASRHPTHCRSSLTNIIAMHPVARLRSIAMPAVPVPIAGVGATPGEPVLPVGRLGGHWPVPSRIGCGHPDPVSPKHYRRIRAQSCGRPRIDKLTEITLEGTRVHYSALAIDHVVARLRALDDTWLYDCSGAIVLHDPSRLFAQHIAKLQAGNPEVRRGAPGGQARYAAPTPQCASCGHR